jgi:metal-responsive CopG/Arc/MetJ family transcriptional regulator
MKRIPVSIPDELHEELRELARRKKTSMSRLVLAAIEDTYEDELDAIAAELGLQEYLADPSSAVSWEELKARFKDRERAAREDIEE